MALAWASWAALIESWIAFNSAACLAATAAFVASYLAFLAAAFSTEEVALTRLALANSSYC